VDETQLETQLHAWLDRVPVPPQPLRARRGGSGIALPLLAGIALIFAVIAGQALNSYRAGASPDPRLPPLPSSIGRDEALARVRNSTLAGRIDRVDAKLMTFDEYRSASGQPHTIPGDPAATSNPVSFGGMSQRPIWVIAVLGEVWPSGRVPVTFAGSPAVSPTPYPAYRWGIILVDAESGALFGVVEAGLSAAWPSTFGNLPYHPAARHTSNYSSSPVPALVARIIRGEAITRAIAVAHASRLDRTEAKLMTWGEFLSHGDPAAALRANLSETAPVWIVVVGGEFGLTPVPPTSWQVIAVDAASGETTALPLTTGSWPTYFEGLPDHPSRE
jgi:hypothetical protein